MTGQLGPYGVWFRASSESSSATRCNYTIGYIVNLHNANSVDYVPRINNVMTQEIEKQQAIFAAVDVTKPIVVNCLYRATYEKSMPIFTCKFAFSVLR